jgi:hypothetical protein
MQAIYQAALNPTKRQTEISFCFYFSFSDIDKKKDSIIHFMDVLQQEGLLGRHIKESILLIKQNYYVGQAQYIPVYTTSENKGVYQLADDKERLQVPILKLIEHV